MIDPAEIENVDFERDLGDMQRKMVLPEDLNKKVMSRIHRKVIDKMTTFESLEEIYLMVVSGLANIKESKYLSLLGMTNAMNLLYSSLS